MTEHEAITAVYLEAVVSRGKIFTMAGLALVLRQSGKTMAEFQRDCDEHATNRARDKVAKDADT